VSYRAEHERLLADGAIAIENGTGVLTRDVVFGSPSTAGAVALGRSCNGRREWIGPDGTMFGAWESRGVEWHQPVPGRRSASEMKSGARW
jgi:hypothetical protein